MKPELTAQILGMYLGRMCDVLDTDEEILYSGVLSLPNLDYWVSEMHVLRPHLRRLESITEEECRELHYMCRGQNQGPEFRYKEDWWEATDEFYTERSRIHIGSAKAWLCLLSRGFDLFGLIDAGLAKEVSE